MEDLPYSSGEGITRQIERGSRDACSGVPAGSPPTRGHVGWTSTSGDPARRQFRVIYEHLAVGMPRRRPRDHSRARDPRQAADACCSKARPAVVLPPGGAVSRTFLRYPVEYTEITSQFSLDRFHPILGQRRPHWGVDLAAPHGTPVRAASDGTVNVAGWESGLGKTIRIDHAGGVASTYGHLSTMAPGVVAGAAVERGQVIGYVGSTGLSTGPHLHYELMRNGGHVDPLEFTCDREPAITPTLVKQFDRARKEVVKQLASIPPTREPTSLSLSMSLLQA
jgi:hypothetical protein